MTCCAWREAGVKDDEYRFEFSEGRYLERFAALVASEERERLGVVTTTLDT